MTEFTPSRAGIYPEQSDTRLAEKANGDPEHYELLDSRQFILHYAAEEIFNKELSKEDLAVCIRMLRVIDRALLEFQPSSHTEPQGQP